MSSIPPDEMPLPGGLAQAWRADQASTAELRRGYARFMRQRTGLRTPLFARWLVGGLVLGLGLAQAASALPEHWFGAREVVAPSPSPARAAQTARATNAAPSLAPSSAPAVITSARPLDPQPDVPRRSPKVVAEPYVQEQWQHAAAALREKDFTRAEQALLDLEQHVDGAERDAARLARAQLLATHGRAAAALSLASDLQAHGHTPLVREKARALVARLSENAPAQRSNPPAAAVNQP